MDTSVRSSAGGTRANRYSTALLPPSKGVAGVRPKIVGMGTPRFFVAFRPLKLPGVILYNSFFAAGAENWPGITSARVWRNWQTRRIQVPVSDKDVEVQLLSPALGQPALSTLAGFSSAPIVAWCRARSPATPNEGERVPTGRRVIS